MIVGGYSLHLYCDAKKCSSKASYDEPKEAQCFRMARGDGWKISRSDSKAYCPNCRKISRVLNKTRGTVGGAY